MIVRLEYCLFCLRTIEIRSYWNNKDGWRCPCGAQLRERKQSFVHEEDQTYWTFSIIAKSGLSVFEATTIVCSFQAHEDYDGEIDISWTYDYQGKSSYRAYATPNPSRSLDWVKDPATILAHIQHIIKLQPFS